jgi:hypothetical protein
VRGRDEQQKRWKTPIDELYPDLVKRQSVRVV